MDPKYNPDRPQLVNDGTQLNFEKRILYPSQYPVLKNDDGSVSTHSMAWGGGDGKFYAYPTVVQAPNGKLVRLPDQAAYLNAIETGEYRSFTTPEDAERYAGGGYKDSWGRGELLKK